MWALFSIKLRRNRLKRAKLGIFWRTRKKKTRIWSKSLTTRRQKFSLYKNSFRLVSRRFIKWMKWWSKISNISRSKLRKLKRSTLHCNSRLKKWPKLLRSFKSKWLATIKRMMVWHTMPRSRTKRLTIWRSSSCITKNSWSRKTVPSPVLSRKLF